MKTRDNRKKLSKMGRSQLKHLAGKGSDLTSFSPASDYFYKKILSYSNKPLHHKLRDDRFIEYIYSALLAWRMNRGKNQLIEFDEFTQNIRGQGGILAKLESATIFTFDEKDAALLKKAFLGMHLIQTKNKEGKFIDTKSIIVSNSKTLHFILPRLVPPVDNAYTGKLFSLDGSYEKQAKLLIKIMREYRGIMENAGIAPNDLMKNYGPNFAKFMDDVVIGAIEEGKLLRDARQSQI